MAQTPVFTARVCYEPRFDTILFPFSYTATVVGGTPRQRTPPLLLMLPQIADTASVTATTRHSLSLWSYALQTRVRVHFASACVATAHGSAIHLYPAKVAAKFSRFAVPLLLRSLDPRN